MVSIKVVLALAFTAFASAGVSPRADNLAAAARIVEKCGDLGVMDPDSGLIPKDTDALKLRVCEGHPLGRDRGVNESNAAKVLPNKNSQSDEDDDEAGPPYEEISLNTRNNVFAERACWYGKDYGCTRGYCWSWCDKKGNGKWCWLAWTGGYGDWVQCRAEEDCNYNKHPTYGCGRGCVVSKSCGCSC